MMTNPHYQKRWNLQKGWPGGLPGCKTYFLSKNAYLSMRKQLQFRDVWNIITTKNNKKNKKNTTSAGFKRISIWHFSTSTSSTVPQPPDSSDPAPPPLRLVHHRLGIRQHLCPGIFEVLIRELGIHASARLWSELRGLRKPESVQWLVPGFSGLFGGWGGLGSVFEIIWYVLKSYIYIYIHVHFWRWKINWISSDLSKDPCYLP